MRRIILLIAPVAIITVYIIILFSILSLETFRTLLGSMGMYFFPPLGKESVIPFAIANNVPWVTVAVSIAMVDVILALFVLWNYDLALHIPFIGPKLKSLAERGKHSLRDTKTSYVVIALFVIVPFDGSGGLAASLIGRMLGLNTLKVFGSVIIGALSGCFLIARFSSYILDIFTPDIKVIGGLIALLVIISAVIWVIRNKGGEKIE